MPGCPVVSQRRRFMRKTPALLALLAILAPAVALGSPDDALLAAVLVKQFADRQLKVGAEDRLRRVP